MQGCMQIHFLHAQQEAHLPGFISLNHAFSSVNCLCDRSQRSFCLSETTGLVYSDLIC